MKLMSYICISMVRGYQKMISRYTPPTCRFHPSCSHYSIKSFRKHGIFLGILLTAHRILRCNPFSRGGRDSVPQKVTFSHFFSRE